MRVLFACLLVLLLVPGWSGEEGRGVLAPKPEMRISRVSLDPDDPGRTRVGGLTFLGGASLRSIDGAFGGFSSLTVRGDRFTLLSDGGNIVRFRMGADWKPFGLGFADLPAGPGTGWDKRDRDSESMTTDPAGRYTWVGFENANAIWRYDGGLTHAQAHVEPRAMAKWEDNGGPESLIRLADGRFLTVAEQHRAWQPRDRRDGLIFTGDPVRHPRPAFTFLYRPSPHYDVSDITQLPDGRLLVLERAFALPFRFTNRLKIVDLAAIQPGATVEGRLLAVLAPPLIHDNFEGVAAQREGDATVIWLVADDNQTILQRSLLLKFRLDR